MLRDTRLPQLAAEREPSRAPRTPDGSFSVRGHPLRGERTEHGGCVYKAACPVACEKMDFPPFFFIRAWRGAVHGGFGIYSQRLGEPPRAAQPIPTTWRLLSTWSSPSLRRDEPVRPDRAS
eukprot:7111320-Prymnesium_polylepis.2